MQTQPFSEIVITDGFWAKKQAQNRAVTIGAVYDRFAETGRFDALACDWKEGDPNKPHFFWDSDVAKWIESVAYLTHLKKEPALEALADSMIDQFVAHQHEDGYINSYFTVIEPQNKLRDRENHELYTAGHMMEAAVAYFEATGKDKFLRAVCRFAKYIKQRFMDNRDTPFVTCGHEEIKIGLMKLYACTKDEDYLALARFFLEERGKEEEMHYAWVKREYSQSHLPFRQQTEAVGHAVRMVYLCCGAADIAKETGDLPLKEVCEKLFDDIVEKKMYLTGGIGSSGNGEAFTLPYDLPSLLSYAESCAAIGLAFFAQRMLKLENKRKYADVIERILYNGFLSSTSLDGKAFFYENPLEVIPYLAKRDTSMNHFRPVPLPPAQRSYVFECSCCPPNITRFVARLGEMIYTKNEDRVYLHQYISNETSFTQKGQTCKLRVTSDFPSSGKVQISLTGGSLNLAYRIPWWAKEQYSAEDGYVYRTLSDGETLTLDFEMPVRQVFSHPDSLFTAGKGAIMRGPVVYCAEGQDNPCHLRNLVLDFDGSFAEGKLEGLDIPTLILPALIRESGEEGALYTDQKPQYTPTKATLIPYYAFANRGEDEMQVWHFVKE